MKSRRHIVNYNNRRYYIFPEHLACYSQDPGEEVDLALEPDCEPQAQEFKYGASDYLLFVITDRCNTTCSYCFRDFINKESQQEEMDLASFTEILDLFQGQASARGKVVQFSGGEVMVKKDIALYFARTLERGFKVWLSSNAISNKLTSGPVLDLFKENPNVHVRISLDGHRPSIHERYRKKGTFRKVVTNIEKLVAHKVAVSVKMVITEENFPQLERYLDFVHSLGVEGFTYNILRKTGNWSSDIKDVTHLRIMQKLVEIVGRKPHLARILYLSPLGKLLDKIYCAEPTLLSTIGYIVNYNGDVYMNDNIFVEEYKLGNYRRDGGGIFRESDLAGRRDTYDLNRKSCQACFADRFCPKGDYGELYNIDKTLQSEFPNCDDLRETFLFCLSLQEDVLVKAMISGECRQ